MNLHGYTVNILWSHAKQENSFQTEEAMCGTANQTSAHSPSNSRFNSRPSESWGHEYIWKDHGSAPALGATDRLTSKHQAVEI